MNLSFTFSRFCLFIFHVLDVFQLWMNEDMKFLQLSLDLYNLNTDKID